VYNPAKDTIGSPEKSGPGIWWVLSVQAAAADTPEKAQRYCQFIQDVVDTLPCEMCRDNAKCYLQQNPPLQARYLYLVDQDTGEYIGMARYVWEFHNAVNRRLGKPEFPWRLFLPRYKYNRDVCSTDRCKKPLAASCEHFV
jgi:hypothetical protein